MMDKILILDFGSQYTQLIARRIREFNVFCEILPYHVAPVFDDGVRGIILSGSPYSVTDEQGLRISLNSLIGKVPVLGICYGAQLLAHEGGGTVSKSAHREYGKAILRPKQSNDPLFAGFEAESQVWMSHADTITQLPKDSILLASTDSIEVAAFRSAENVAGSAVYGIQFHPEVTHSADGARLLSNFVLGICGCRQDWTPASFAEQTIASLSATIGSDHVLMALSGGVDSTVAAVLLHRAIGHQLHCFFIDNGLLRKGEYEEVLQSYLGMGLNVVGIDAGTYFLNALAGISDPERKRKIIGSSFIEIFEQEAARLPQVQWLGQGTIYPDVIESLSVHGPSATIKSHHNVGGLPERLKLRIVEPLRMLFKDEVRRVGQHLAISPNILGRHPFPGPGLSIRILGDISSEKVAMLQEADAIFIQCLKEWGWYEKVWQAGAVLLPVQSVGVMGDERTYEKTIALRCVNSVDGMTAEWSALPYDLLAEVSNKIINRVKGINRVVYDISTKPPATIEWE